MRCTATNGLGRIVLFMMSCVAAGAICAGSVGAQPVILTMGSGAGETGDSVTVSSTVDNSCCPLAGYSYGVCSDPSLVTVSGIAQGADIAAVNGGTGPQFYSPMIFPGGWTIGCVVSFVGGGTLPAGPSQELEVVTYELVGPPGSSAPLVICQTLGSPPTLIQFIGGGGVVLPVTAIDGVIDILGGAPPFVRGDTDGDGLFNALADSLYLLAHGFQGGPAPPCLEAADTDDNGVLNALPDTLYLLSHGFQGGPPPAAPYPMCGMDPDLPNSIGCDLGCP